jgi:hypothetical protein
MRSSSLLLVIAAALSISHVGLAADPFQSIRVGANRSRYVGACPVEIVFTGNINLNSPHQKGLAFNYYWLRSDGAKGPVNLVRPSPSQRMVIVKEPWTLGTPGRHQEVSVRLFVNSGETHLEQPSQVVSVTCK